MHWINKNSITFLIPIISDVNVFGQPGADVGKSKYFINIGVNDKFKRQMWKPVISEFFRNVSTKILFTFKLHISICFKTSNTKALVSIWLQPKRIKEVYKWHLLK